MSEIPPPTVPPAVPPPPGGSYTPPPPPPLGGSGSAPNKPGDDRAMMNALAYLWPLALIPLLTKKDDPDIQWHAKNGIGITIGEIVVWIVVFVISIFIPFAACFVPCAAFVAALAFRIVLILKANKGERVVIPVLTDLGLKIDV